jgi:hypothetical protein
MIDKQRHITFIIEQSPDSRRWYMMCYDHRHLTKAIWSIHGTPGEAETARLQALAGNHQIQREARGDYSS